MRLLLDTHVCIWCLFEPARLSEKARTVIEEPQTTCLYSILTAWEIAIKAQLQKLKLPLDLPEVFSNLDSERFQCLDLRREHCLKLSQLPFHHRDPFDRMLIAQALTENLTLVSADSAFDAYPIRRLW